MKAIWNNAIIAESDEIISLEGNVYFPITALKREFIAESKHSTICPWKGKASYYTLVVKGEKNTNAAWYYPNPSDEALQIKDHVAFWNGVEILD